MGQAGVSTQFTMMDAPILHIPENTAHPLSLEDLLSETTSSIHLGGTGIQQSGGCTDSLSYDQHTTVLAQQTSMDPPILQIPESITHPLRLEDFISERTSSIHLGGISIQQSGSRTDLLSSGRHTTVSAQHTSMNPPILQIPESITHPLRLEDLISERTSSMHFRETGIQQSGACTDSLSSDPHTTVSARHTSMDPPFLQISESITHPLRLEDLIPERTSSMHFTGIGIQQSGGCTDSLSSDRHTTVSAQHTSMDPPILQIPESVTRPLRVEDLIPEITSSMHFRGSGIQQSRCCTDSLFYDQHITVSTQQASMDPPILQIPESITHPLRLEDLISERTSFMHFTGTDIQQSGGFTDSFSSDRHTTVPAQRNLDPSVDTLDPSRSQEDLISERAPSVSLRSTGVQLEQGSQLFSNLMPMSWVPLQAIYADPLENESCRNQKQSDLCFKKHEEKKVQLQYECELEIENVRRKYDVLCQDVEREQLRDKKMFQAINEKVFLHKIFAAEVSSKFYDNKEGISTPVPGPSLNLSQQLQTPLLQAQLPCRPSSTPLSIPPSSTSSHPATSTINQESTAPLLSTPRSRSRLPSLPLNHPTGSSSHASPVFLSNTARGPTTPRATPHVGRSPAPHLHRFRPNAMIPASIAPYSPAVANQQPLPASQISTTVAPLIDLGRPLTSTQPSISLDCWNSQTTISRSSPLFSSSPMDLTQDIEAELLESLLSNLPAMNNEVPTSSMVDVRSNSSWDIICLSDDE